MSEKKKPSKYYNFGAGWLFEDTGVINFDTTHSKNKRANKDQGYKLFLVPVDDTGDPVGEGIEVTKFRVKQIERGPKTPEKAPDFQAYAWE